jgi:hypothetical protein
VAAADILGRKVSLDSRPYTVVGVMPAGVNHPGNSYNSIAYGDTVDAWTPFTFEGIRTIVERIMSRELGG